MESAIGLYKRFNHRPALYLPMAIFYIGWIEPEPIILLICYFKGLSVIV